MRKLLLAMAGLFLLGGCGNTPGNMSHEVAGWFNNDRSPALKIQGAAQAQPVPAPETASNAITTEILKPPRPAKIAILLPLSGAHADIGKSFLDAAQMAVLELSADHFELMPFDSGEDPATANKAAEAAISEGAELIIGPVFSNVAASVKMVAGQHAIPMITLSSDWSIAGQSVYVLGFSPVEQLQRMAGFLAKRGISRVAIMTPDNAYGKLAAQSLQNQQNGLYISATEYYGDDEESVKKASISISNQQKNLQALFLPDGGASLLRAATALNQMGIQAKGIPIIGTALWDDPTIAENLLKAPALQGGWFAAPETANLDNFKKRFVKNYGYQPQRLADLAYDATALAAILAKQGQPYDTPHLTNPNGFAGLEGIFRLTLSGTAEHGLAIIEVTAAGFKVIEPSPTRF